MPCMKLFFFFFSWEGPGFLVVVVVFLGGTVEEVAAGHLRAGREVDGVGGGGGEVLVALAYDNCIDKKLKLFTIAT